MATSTTPDRGSLWDSGRDETVEVNQRALIDKVLARYSGEFTVFRELLQNADDAGAKAAEIRFQTKDGLESTKGIDGLPDLKREIVHRWVFRNNGSVFQETDWNRLKKIAEGNPDEQKIGAFGVGFYSLFSVTEEPFVKSGAEWMGFYWKDNKDQLLARRGKLPEAASSEWTIFEMELRDPTPMPGRPMDIARFLASSLTFMVHLSEVSLYFNDRCLARLSKDVGVPKAMEIPRGLKNTSQAGMMATKQISATPLNIKAEILRWVYTTGSERIAPVAIEPPKPAQTSFFSSLFSTFTAPTPSRTPEPLPPPPKAEDVDPLKVIESSVLLSIFAAQVDVRLDRKLSVELERATKKKPPSTCTYQLIYTGKDEYDASKKEEEAFSATGSVFQGLRADLEGTGTARIFIGHSTGQSTGIGGHMAARFIPTVERESIDLVDRNVAVWNKELLHVGGFLCRAAYEMEMSAIKKLWDGAAEGKGINGVPDEELRQWLQGRCLHALKFFTFHTSTPSAMVSHSLSQAYFGCGDGMQIYSSAGIKPASQVRLASPVYATFIKQIPTLPEGLSSGAKAMVDALRQRGMIKDISFTDILQELKARPLTEEEMVACLKWRISLASSGSQAFEQHVRDQFLQAAVLITSANGPGGNERVIPLSTIQTFINARGAITPSDGPFPAHTVPFSVSKTFSADALTSFFGWSELTVPQWVAHLVSAETLSQGPDTDITRSPIFAERMFGVLARAWPSLSNQQQGLVINLLKSKQCIPTKSGLKVPEEAYFLNVNVFPDLPIVFMPKGTVIRGHLEKIMIALGVRKHVHLQVVFDRMIKSGDWTIADLMKYLVAVRDTLSPLEMDRLRQTAAFPKQKGTEGATAQAQTVRYRPNQLYEPVDALRQLGLPIVDWGEQPKWRAGSEEAKLLFHLGLQRFPPVGELLTLASNEDRAVRNRALQYFLDNFANHYSNFNPDEFPNLAYIPAVKSDGSPFMAKHSEVFSDAACTVLGFSVVHQSMRNEHLHKLKLMESPPTTRIVPILQKSPPQDEATARKWFEYLAGRLGDFSQSQTQQLSLLPFVPVMTDEKPKGRVQMHRPTECYFGGETRAQAQLHSKLFIFIDFGQRANAFLRFCGVKNEPTIDEIGRLLITDPKRFFDLAGGLESYLAELRHIASNLSGLSSRTRNDMKKASILVGSRRVAQAATKEHRRRMSDASDEVVDLTFDLLRADQLVIVDDTNAYSLFGEELYGAPQEDIIESFYMSLGSPRLSKLIKEEYKSAGGEVKDSKLGNETRSLVLERLPLFLHERNQAKPRLSFDWLSSGNNFRVKVVGKLNLTRSLNFGNRASRTQEASAAVQYDGRHGPVVLLIGGNTSLDLYEVANSFCKLLFDSHRINDSLLFMTILSTDLRSLKRRGFNIDRILNQRKLEKQTLEAARRQEHERQLGATSIPRGPQDISKPVEGAPPPIPARPTSTAAKQLAPAPAPDGASTESLNQNAAKASNRASTLFSNFRQKISGSKPETEPLLPKPQTALGPPKTQSAPPDRQAQVTPARDIERNIQMAIEACRPEKGKLLHNREHMETVKESLNEGYCDASGMAENLVLCGEVEHTKFYVANDIPNGDQIRLQKIDSLTRFVAFVINPLRQVYNVPPASVHVFYDTHGPLIAFNRGGSLFLNLRYYESWHDQQVLTGELSKALTSWYFTLAHEIAHNLVIPHNSEHEFYFSSLAETHFPAFAAMLASIA